MLSNNLIGANTIDVPDSRDGRYFRRRFRIPFSLFQALTNCMVNERWFTGFDAQGRGLLDATKKEVMRGASLHVKVLSALRILGRGLVFDECFDGSGCGESTIQTRRVVYCPMHETCRRVRISCYSIVIMRGQLEKEGHDDDDACATAVTASSSCAANWRRKAMMMMMR